MDAPHFSLSQFKLVMIKINRRIGARLFTDETANSHWFFRLAATANFVADQRPNRFGAFSPLR